MKIKHIALATSVASTLVAAYLAAGMTALNYAAKRKPPTTSKYNPSNVYPVSEEDKEWIDNQTFKDVELKTFDDLILRGKYLEAENKTNKILLAVHGYHADNFRDFSYYLRFYHDLGFNILMPDNRAHGTSDGNYSSFGWYERLDVLEWIHALQAHYEYAPLQIVLHGISMGAATVLMVSGEKLPEDVKCIISDCSYTTAIEEFKAVLSKHHLPSFLFVPSANLVSKRKLGFDFNDASAIRMVAKSTTPTLFIHGDDDNLVPDNMVYELYNACSAPKDLLVIKGAKHADS
ncbi:MAG: alpha/beta hydrolase, partial [Erysipelotrichaceae bacterium]|nr:alpha/beta hydrolase [Erysipelotrichaceae bacterium]